MILHIIFRIVIQNLLSRIGNKKRKAVDASYDGDIFRIYVLCCFIFIVSAVSSPLKIKECNAMYIFFLNSTPTPEWRKENIKYFISANGKRTHYQSRLQSHLCLCATKLFFFNLIQPKVFPKNFILRHKNSTRSDEQKIWPLQYFIRRFILQ